MVDDIFKYRTGNQIILYHCTYSRLLSTVKNVVQNSMRLIKSAESGLWIDM